jgi:hypothetical protein
VGRKSLFGINDAGQCVGYDSGPQNQGYPASGLLLKTPEAVESSSIVAPGATNTVLYGINDAGVICGFADQRGFVYHENTFTMFAFPGPSHNKPHGIVNTEAHGIINPIPFLPPSVGIEMVGSYTTNDNQVNPQHGFVATIAQLPVENSEELVEAQVRAVVD